VTINVVLKCADGLVLAADSLITTWISDTDSNAAVPAGGVRGNGPYVMLPFHEKIFPLGELPVCAVINGMVSSPITTVKECIDRFVYSKEMSNFVKSDQYQVTDIADALFDVVDEDITPYLAENQLEIILAGFSRSSKARFGEIYSLKFPRGNEKFNRILDDKEFGIYSGGDDTPVERFRYGFDRNLLYYMWVKREKLFNEVAEYVVGRLRKTPGVVIPDDLKVTAPSIDDFNHWLEYSRALDIFQLLAEKGSYRFNGTLASEDIDAILQKSYTRFSFPERLFSLQQGIELCQFLAMCAFAANNYTYKSPQVGSHITIIAVTRHQGVQLIRRWKPRFPAADQ